MNFVLVPFTTERDASNIDYDFVSMVNARIELENLIFYPFGSVNRAVVLIKEFKERFLKN